MVDRNPLIDFSSVLVFVAWGLGSLSTSFAADPVCDLGKDAPLFVEDSLSLAAQCTNTQPGATYFYRLDFNGGEGSISTPDDSIFTAEAATPSVTLKLPKPGRYSVFLTLKQGADSFRFFRLQTVVPKPTPTAPTRSGTLALSPDGQKVYCVNPDNHSFSAFNASDLTRLWEQPTGKNPRSLAFDSQGRIWIANQDDATLTLHNANTGAKLFTVSLPRGSRPAGLVFDPKGTTAYVALYSTGQLLRLDASESGNPQVTGTLSLFPTPYALAVASDGGSVYVTRFISPVDHGEFAEVDVGTFTLRHLHTLAKDPGPEKGDNAVGSRGIPNYLTGITLSPDGGRALISATKDNVERGLARDGQEITFESTVRSLVMDYDLTTKRTPRLRYIDQDNSSLPQNTVFLAAGQFYLNTLLASNRINLLDAFSHRNLGRLPTPETDSLLGPEDLRLSADGSKLYVNFFTGRKIALYNVTDAGGDNLLPLLKKSPTVVTDSLPPIILKGKRIFYNSEDRRMSRDGYLTCATCHFNGQSDGRVWDFTQRGEGLRRTTTLLGKGGTSQGPVHWTANFNEIQDFENDIRNGFDGNGFMDDALYNADTRNNPLGTPKAGLSAELDALAAYVTSLAQVHVSPYRNVEGTLTDEAIKGKAIFESDAVGCAKCHRGPYYTDSGTPFGASAKAIAAPFATAEAIGTGTVLHDVGTLKKESGKRRNAELVGFDTPTLLGLWEGGPYLHDGSALSLKDVINSNPKDSLGVEKHGKTAQLSQVEKDQLLAFLMQLDGSEGLPAGISRGGKPGSAVNSWTSLRVRITPDGLQISGFPPSGVDGVFWSLVDLSGKQKVKGRLFSHGGVKQTEALLHRREELGAVAPGFYRLQLQSQGKRFDALCHLQ